MRIVLLNMPFSSLRFPSFALSQLAAVVEETFGDTLAVEIIYGNHTLAQTIGPDLYDEITHEARHQPTGLGDWLFRQIAFPELEPNEVEYFKRYYRDDAELIARVKAVRQQLPAFCERLCEEHELAAADVVGFTTMFAQTVPSLALARTIKDANPRVVTVLGGANCEAPMGAEIVALASAVDFVFSGPALRTFVDFLRCVVTADLDECHTLIGVVSTRNRHDPLYQNAIGPQRPIDEIVEPKYDAFIEAFDATFAGTGVEPTLFFETSRGCWWGEKAHCTFCGLNGASMNYRALHPQLAIEQFEHLFARYYPWCKSYFCVDNIMPTSYPRDVLPHVETPKGASIFYEVKASLDEDDLSRLARAGVSLLQPGIEALATSTLKLMKKGTSSFQNIAFLQNCVNLGIQPLWNLLIGFPGEPEQTYEEYLRKLPLLHHLPPPLGVFPVRFDRFSPYFREAASYGLQLRPFDHYELTYPLCGANFDDLAYYFIDERDAQYKRAAAKWRPMLAEAVDAWHRRWTSGDPPQLRLEEHSGEWQVVDTRGEALLVSAVDYEARRLLIRLQKPVRLLRTDPDEVRALDYVRAHGLIFEDAGRAVSLLRIPRELSSAEAQHDAGRVALPVG